MSRGLRSGVSLLLVIGLVAMTGLEARAQTPKKGGVLKVAVLGDPPTLDSHWTTANFVEIITQHIYESLYTLDQNYQPIPVLAEALPAVSADGLTYTIKLRQGIRFHNGKEMTSDDVVASLKRWGGYAVQAKAMWASVEGVRAVDGATRVASLESGEVDFADDLQAVAYDRIKDNPKLRPLIVRPYAWAMAVFNKKEGLMTNVKLRQAVQAAVDIEPNMRAAVGNPL